MEQSLALLPSHLRVRIAEYESNGGEEVALSGTIATDNHIALWRERFDDGLFLVTGASLAIIRDHFVPYAIPLEPLDDDLLDMHLRDAPSALRAHRFKSL